METLIILIKDTEEAELETNNSIEHNGSWTMKEVKHPGTLKFPL